MIRKVISGLNLSADQTAVLRTMAGHIVAGTATPDEQRAFEQTLNRLSFSQEQ